MSGSHNLQLIFASAAPATFNSARTHIICTLKALSNTQIKKPREEKWITKRRGGRFGLRLIICCVVISMKSPKVCILRVNFKVGPSPASIYLHYNNSTRSKFMLDAPYFFTWRADGVVWFLDASSPTRSHSSDPFCAQPDSQARPLFLF